MKRFSFLAMIFIFPWQLTHMPPAVVQILDRAFPGWQMLRFTLLPDSVNSNSAYLDRVYGYSNFYTCDLNGDSLPDYAVAVTTNSGSANTEHFVAIVSTHGAYTLYRLVESNVNPSDAGKSALYLARKGEEISDFDSTQLSPRIFKTDAITYFPLIGCCSTTFVFENGSFVQFTSGD